MIRKSVFCIIVICLSLRGMASEPPPSGKQIFQHLCARCHGSHGEGVEDECPDPLRGTLSVAELRDVIHETMPADAPEKCEDEAAQRVAQYIHQAFYAEKNGAGTAARIELCRMTARQYENAIADLLGGFTGTGAIGKRGGLTGKYYRARNFRGDKKVFQRVDPRVNFNFGTGSPDAKKIDKAEFSIQWQGAIIAEETGEYEFCVRTDNGARLWVNDRRTPLIDAWVKSGDTTEHHGSIRLLGGRPYYLRLDYSKYKSKTASIVLQWKPPHGVLRTIAPRNLSPNPVPRLFVIGTEFPPDDRSTGYERGTRVSEAWQNAVTYAAIETANYVVDNLQEFSKCQPAASDRATCLKKFCTRFARYAFRRPLSESLKATCIDQQFKRTKDLKLAVKRSLLLILTTPQFLYLEIDSRQLDDYDVAARLSFGLWDSLPDRTLIAAATAGKLRTSTQVAQQARRMLSDDRAHSKMRDFLHDWLDYARAADLSKDKHLFPQFDKTVAADLRTSLDLFLDDVVWSDQSDFRQLLLSSDLYVNRRLAAFYGIAKPSDDGFHKVTCDPQKRAGILTHPFLLTTFAYHQSSSPIHRGVFIIRSLVGRTLKPPPIAVAPADPGSNPDLTTRQRVAKQTAAPTCQTCHHLINPLGFGLENYDAVGRFRTTENGKPIDATGTYKTLAGNAVSFDGARRLAESLAASREVHRCFVELLFQDLVKQPVAAYGADRLDQLTRFFEQSGCNVQQLVVEIMRQTALRTN